MSRTGSPWDRSPPLEHVESPRLFSAEKVLRLLGSPPKPGFGLPGVPSSPKGYEDQGIDHAPSDEQIGNAMQEASAIAFRGRAMDGLEPAADSSSQLQDLHSGTAQWHQDGEAFALGLAALATRRYGTPENVPWDRSPPLEHVESPRLVGSPPKPGFGLPGVPSSPKGYEDQGIDHAPSDEQIGNPMREASAIAFRVWGQSRKWAASSVYQNPHISDECERSYPCDIGTYRIPQGSASILLRAEHPFLIADVTDLWSEQSSFSREEVVGRTFASVLYGPGTEHQRASKMLEQMALGRACISVLTSYTRSGLSYRKTILILPIDSHRGVRKPHLLAICDMNFPCGTPMPPPRLHLPEDEPALLFAGVAPYPIVDVNELWLSSCGFVRDEVVGHSASILQGPDTEPEVLVKLMQAVQDRKKFSGTLTNYTRGGQAMSNTVLIVPVAVVGADKFYFISTSNFGFHPARRPPAQRHQYQVPPSAVTTVLGDLFAPGGSVRQQSTLGMFDGSSGCGAGSEGQHVFAEDQPPQRHQDHYEQKAQSQNRSDSVFFREVPDAERQTREVVRKAAVERYLKKREKWTRSRRPARLPGQKCRQKYASRQSIAHHRPRVCGRFVKTAVTITGEGVAKSGTAIAAAGAGVAGDNGESAQPKEAC